MIKVAVPGGRGPAKTDVTEQETIPEELTDLERKKT